jgi:hypothetical protein
MKFLLLSAIFNYFCICAPHRSPSKLVWFPEGLAPIPEGNDPEGKTGFAYFETWRVQQIKQGISNVMRDNKKLYCLAFAIAGLETSYGQNMPNQQEQQRRNKWGKAMQENCKFLFIGFTVRLLKN